jgi:hypothetical protein
MFAAHWKRAAIQNINRQPSQLGFGPNEVSIQNHIFEMA